MDAQKSNAKKSSTKSKVDKKVACKLEEKNREIRDIKERASRKVEDADKRASEVVKDTLNSVKNAQIKPKETCNKCSESNTCPHVEKLTSAVNDLKACVVEQGKKK